MKRTLSLILIVLLFLLGIGVFSYPFVASWQYQKSALVVQSEYNITIEEIDENEINELLEGARRYNEALISAGMILTEPFDPDRYDIDAMYEKLPTDSPEIGYVSIPSLKLTLPIYHTVSDEALQIGAGHIPHTSLPVGGQSTHAVISAHAGLPNAEMFTHLDRLGVGNVFTIEILGQTLTYQVYSLEVVEPDNIESLEIVPGEDIVTLITCTPIGVNTHRLLVHGKRVPNIEVEKVIEEEPKIVRKLTYVDYVSIIACILIILFIIILLLLLLQERKRKVNEKNN